MCVTPPRHMFTCQEWRRGLLLYYMLGMDGSSMWNVVVDFGYLTCCTHTRESQRVNMHGIIFICYSHPFIHPPTPHIPDWGWLVGGEGDLSVRMFNTPHEQ